MIYLTLFLHQRKDICILHFIHRYCSLHSLNKYLYYHLPVI